MSDKDLAVAKKESDVQSTDGGTKVLRNGSRRTFTLGKEKGKDGKWIHWNPGEVRAFPVSVIDQETKEHLSTQEAGFFLNYHGVVDTAVETKNSAHVAQTIDNLKKQLAEAESARDAAQAETATLKEDAKKTGKIGK